MNPPTRKNNLAWRPVGDETVIIDLDGNRTFHQLNEVGSLIWNLCDGKHSVEEIEQKLMEEFAVDLTEAKADLNFFMKELTELQLLK